MRRAEDPNTHRDRERVWEIPTMVTLRTPTESHQHRYYHQIVGTTIGKGFLFFLSSGYEIGWIEFI